MGLEPIGNHPKSVSELSHTLRQMNCQVTVGFTLWLDSFFTEAAV